MTTVLPHSWSEHFTKYTTPSQINCIFNCLFIYFSSKALRQSEHTIPWILWCFVQRRRVIGTNTNLLIVHLDQVTIARNVWDQFDGVGWCDHLHRPLVVLEWPGHGKSSSVAAVASQQHVAPTSTSLTLVQRQHHWRSVETHQFVLEDLANTCIAGKKGRTGVSQRSYVTRTSIGIGLWCMRLGLVNDRRPRKYN